MTKKSKAPKASKRGAAIAQSIPQAMAPEAVSAVTKARGKIVAKAKGAVAAKLAATTKAPRAPKPLDVKVVALIELLKSKAGTTNEEAASRLKLKSKGDKPHQTPAAQVRAMIRDKVRPLHTVTAEHVAERGVVYHIR